MTRTTAIRNLAIVLVLAGLVDLVPGGGTVANVVLQVISLAFLAMIAWIASRLYREHRLSIYSLGPGRRTTLYAAVGVATLTFSASDRLLVDPIGTLLWLVLIAGAAYAVFLVYRSSRQY